MRDVEQNRSGNGAIHGAVVEAGQHDQAGLGRHVVGDRQQDGDGGDGADARQHAQEVAERDAEEAIEQVLQRSGFAQPDGEIVDQVHPRHQASIGSGIDSSTTNTSQVKPVKAPINTIVGSGRLSGLAQALIGTRSAIAGASP